MITRPDMETLTVSLVAETDVARGGFLKRLSVAANVLRADYFSGN